MGNQPFQRLVFSHRDDAIEEADIQRMKTCLQAAGYEASEADIAAANRPTARFAFARSKGECLWGTTRG